MVTQQNPETKKESTLFGDLLWVLFLSGVGIFLIFALISIINAWSGSSLKSQFLGY